MNKEKKKQADSTNPGPEQPDSTSSRQADSTSSRQEDIFGSMYAEIDEKAEQEKPKRKRGRPSKKEKFEQEQQKVEMTAVLVQPIVSFVSLFLSKRLGQKWLMTKEETKEGAKVTTAVLNRYMPSFEDKAELLAFGMFWTGYVLTRTATDSQESGKNQNE